METIKINILTLTPLHIGNGKSLTSVGEFVCTNNAVRIIDQKKLNDLLMREKLNDEFTEYILNYSVNTHVWRFFEEHGISKELRYLREIPLHANVFDPDSNNILELAIETEGSKYVPGSTVKGAIRTLLFAHAIANDSTIRNRVENIIEQEDKLEYIRKEINKVEDDIYNDDLNNVRIEDSETVPDKDLVVEIAKRTHLFGVKTDGLDNLRECVNTDVSIETAFTLNNNARGFESVWINSADLSELFTRLNFSTLAVIEHELKLLKPSSHPAAGILTAKLKSLSQSISASKGRYAVIRLGKGKTFFFQVIVSVLKEHYRTKILDLLLHENEEKIANYPKTRVLNDINDMFGWIMIEKLKVPVAITPMFDNNIEELLKDKTILKARCTGEKTVSLILNGIQLDNVQLVNKYKLPVEAGDDIEVVVGQVTKEGKLNQVKLITE